MNANSLTTGSGLSITSTSTALTTGSLASLTASGSNAAVTGNVLALNMSGVLSAGNTLKLDNAGTGQALLVNSGNIRFGTSSNGVNLAGTTYEPVLSGTAQHSRTVTLTAEYPGSTLDASGTANSGTMTAPHENATAGFLEGYYNWTTTTASPAQTYDVVVAFALPSDWSAWNPTTTPITVDTNSSTTAGTTTVTGYITDTAGAAETNWNASYNCTVNPGTTSGWITSTPSCNLTGTYAANGVMNMHFRLTAINSSSIRLGTIKLNYKSKW